MKSKKILSLVLVLCMVLPMLPVFATEATQTELAGNIRVIYENDFESNIDGWTIGETKAAEGTYNLSHETYEDKGVLALSSTAGITNYFCGQPTAFLDFDDIDFTSGNKIVIEMSLKQSGSNEFGQAWSYLKYNRPNKSDLTYAKADGSEFHTKNISEDADNWWTMLMFQSNVKETTDDAGVTTTSGANKVSYMYNNEGDTSLATMSDADTKADWTDIKIVIDEGTKYFSVNGKTGDQEYSITDGWINANAYEINNTNIAYGTQLTDYDSLDNLTLYLRNYAQTLYVDSFKVYEISPVYASAVISGGSTVKYDEAVELEFVNVYADADKTTASTIAAVPEGAVKINDVNAVQNYDAVNQILSVMPENGFVEGETYTVTLDTDVLEEGSIIYSGTESFTVRARGERSNGLVVNDTFENEADKDNWVIGGANDGYKAVTDIVTVDGDNKALSVKMETNTNAANGANKVPNVIRSIGNGIEFAEDKTVVIKTRMKVKSSKIDESGAEASTAFHLRMNSIGYETNGFNTDQHAIGWLTYTLFHLGQEGIKHPVGVGRLLSSTSGWYYDGGTISGTENSAILDKWVDYTITVDGINNKTVINAVCSDISLNKTTTTSTIAVTPRALANEYGEGTDKTHFDALDTLSFALFDNANTDSELLIDYFKVVELVGGRIINQSGASAMYNEPLKFTLESDKPISAVSEGAVKIEGVAASFSYDAETQEITLTPETDLTIGNLYNVTIDKDVLENNGVGYKGVTSFAVRARDERKTGKIISDDFNDGTTQGWTVGAANDAYKAGLQVVDVEGEEGNKALKISMSATASGSGNQPNVTRVLGNGIEFKDNEWVTITARVKKSSEGFSYKLKANRPDTVEQVPYEYQWAAYGIMGNNTSGKTVTLTGTQDLGDYVGGYSYMPEDPGATTVGTDWITYTIVFTPEEGLFWVTGVKDDGTYVTTQRGREGAMYLAGTAVEKIYGVAPAAKMKLDFLDTLTFIAQDGTTGDLYIDYVNVSINDTSVIGKASLTVDGEEIDEITAGTTVKPSFTINPEEDVTEYTVISALYIDGILEDTHINPLTVNQMGYVYTEEDGWVIPSALEGKYEIKAFVWNTLEGMKPVSTVTKAESAAND